jgi:hypothetical protein
MYFFSYLCISHLSTDRLCGLMVRVPGYRSSGPGFVSRCYHIFWEVVGLERGPFSLVSITEKLLEWKSRGSGFRKPKLTAVAIHCADHATSSARNFADKRRSLGRYSSLADKATELSYHLSICMFVIYDSDLGFSFWRMSWLRKHKMSAWSRKTLVAVFEINRKKAKRPQFLLQLITYFNFMNIFVKVFWTRKTLEGPGIPFGVTLLVYQMPFFLSLAE